MKKWKLFLIIAMLIAALACLCGCDAYYCPNGGDWVYGTDGSIYYTPSDSNWVIKVFSPPTYY